MTASSRWWPTKTREGRSRPWTDRGVELRGTSTKVGGSGLRPVDWRGQSLVRPVDLARRLRAEDLVTTVVLMGAVILIDQEEAMEVPKQRAWPPQRENPGTLDHLSVQSLRQLPKHCAQEAVTAHSRVYLPPLHQALRRPRSTCQPSPDRQHRPGRPCFLPDDTAPMKPALRIKQSQ